MTTAQESRRAANKKPWYKRTWVWVVVVVLVAIGGLSNLGAGSKDVGHQAEQTPPAKVAPSEVGAEEADEVDNPLPVTVDEVARAASLEQAIKESLGGVESFSELYVSDPTLWGGYISGVRTDGQNAFVTLQIANNDPARKDFGKRAAKALSTLLPASAVERISWIIVEDASGVVIDQKQPSPLM